MADTQVSVLLRHVRGLLRPGGGAGRPDRWLLERFSRERDEKAFATLVQRHAPLVWGVCRRLLGHEQDAEDAFQATFLVLARNAASVRKGESLAGYLYGVATRVAARARTDAAVRRRHEGRAAARRGADVEAEVSWREVREVIDVELRRLPQKYRVPLILCYLEGKTQDEAARELGWTAGTFRGRLDRGRQRLRDRLARRGLTLSAVLLPAALTPSGVEAAVRGLPSDRAVALAEGVVRAMSMIRYKVAVALLTVLTVLAAGAGLAAHREPDERRPAQRPAKPASEAKQGPVDRYGDPLPAGARARLGTMRLRHRQGVEGVAFSPDGKLLASGGWDEVVRVWDSHTGKVVRELIDRRRECTLSIAFSPDGTRVASAGESGTVRLWDVRTGKELFSRRGKPQRIRGIAFSPDGRTLASAGGEGSLTLWGTADGAELRRLPTGDRQSVNYHCVAFSPNGKLFASGYGTSIRVWDLKANGQSVVVPKAHGREVLSLVFLDNKTLISSGFHYVTDRTKRGETFVRGVPEIRFWEAATGRQLRELKQKDTEAGRCSVAISPDRKVLAAAYRDKIRLWSMPGGKPLREIGNYRNCYDQHAGDLAFSPDGKRLAARSGDHAVRVWDVSTGKQLLEFSQSHAGRVEALAYSPDGRRIATGATDGTFRLWDPRTAREVFRHRFGTGDPAGAISIAFSPDGQALAVGGYDNHPTKLEFLGLLERWAVAGGKRAWGENPDDRISALAFSPDGKTVAAAAWDLGRKIRRVGAIGDDILLRDHTTGRELGRLSGRWGQVHALHFSADGKTLMSVGDDRTIRVWDLAARKQRSQFTLAVQRPMLRGAAFSPDGRLLATSELFTDLVVLWDPTTGKEVGRIQVPKSKGSVLAFSPDGRTLASGSIGLTMADQQYDYDLHLWDLVTNRQIRRYRPGSTTAHCLAFSPDGRELTSGMDNGTALVWDLTAGPAPKDPHRLWAALGDADPARAYPAVWALALAPEKALALFKDRLRPGTPPDEKRVRSLIAALDSDAFAAREAAFKELEHLGENVEPLLRQALRDRPSLEQRKRLDALLAGVRTLRSPGALRQVRAVQVLEAIGSKEARQMLQALAEDAGAARRKREAKEALQRLARRSAFVP